MELGSISLLETPPRLEASEQTKKTKEPLKPLSAAALNRLGGQNAAARRWLQVERAGLLPAGSARARPCLPLPRSPQDRRLFPRHSIPRRSRTARNLPQGEIPRVGYR